MISFCIHQRKYRRKSYYAVTVGVFMDVAVIICPTQRSCSQSPPTAGFGDPSPLGLRGKGGS